MAVRKRAARIGSVTADDWVSASRAFLVKGGIESVKVEPLARYLGVTPGSFYWHFKNRASLHRWLLRDWLASNVTPFFSTFEAAEPEPREQYLALAYVWILSPEFDPAFDVAIRNWGLTSKLVSRLMRQVDRKRIGLYRSIFEEFGHDERAAFVRARTMYYHQIGYYAMQVEEAIEDRLLLVPYYADVLAGDGWLLQCKSPDEVRDALTSFKVKQMGGDLQALGQRGKPR